MNSSFNSSVSVSFNSSVFFQIHTYAQIGTNPSIIPWILLLILPLILPLIRPLLHKYIHTRKYVQIRQSSLKSSFNYSVNSFFAFSVIAQIHTYAQMCTNPTSIPWMIPLIIRRIIPLFLPLLHKYILTRKYLQISKFFLEFSL